MLRRGSLQLTRREAVTVILVLATTFGIVAGTRYRKELRAPVPWTRRDATGGDYEPRYRASTGRELTFYYIGKRNCAASSSPQVAADVKALLRDVERDTRARGIGMSAVGVALDWSVDEGLAHLQGIAAFDEVHAGRNWFNTFFLHEMAERYGVESATPTLILVDRVVSTPDKAHPARPRVMSVGRVIAVARGSGEISRWRTLRPWRTAAVETRGAR